jgi:N-acetylglutamate synthase-like GNAT family acetyltransferase
MKIQKATIKDLKEIAKLFLEYDKYECRLDKNMKKSSLNAVEKDEKEHFKLGTEYLIIKEEDNIIGALNINIDKRGKEKIGILHTLIITKKARGQGYGNKLVDYALNYFKKQKCRRVKTFIHIANKNALDFWKNQGFNVEEGYTASKRLK